MLTYSAATKVRTLNIYNFNLRDNVAPISYFSLSN